MLYGVYGAIALDSIATNNWSILSWARPGCLIDHLLTRCLIQTQVLTSDANVELNTTLFWNQQNGCCHLSFLEPPMALLLSTQLFRSVPFWVENVSSKISLDGIRAPYPIKRNFGLRAHNHKITADTTTEPWNSALTFGFPTFTALPRGASFILWLLRELTLRLVPVSLRYGRKTNPSVSWPYLSV